MSPGPGLQDRFLRRNIRRPGGLIYLSLVIFVLIFLFWSMSAFSWHIPPTQYRNSKLVTPEKNEGNAKLSATQSDTEKLERNDKTQLESTKLGKNSTRTLLPLLSLLLEPVKSEQSEFTRRSKSSEPKLDPENVFRDGPTLNLAQNDTRLLQFIREHHLFLPSDKPYNLTQFPTGDPTGPYGVGWKFAFQLLKNKTEGFFIECGANDGESLSNTLVLERDYGWTGLLIEGDPLPFKNLLATNRKAWLVDTCLSGETYPMEVQMQRHKTWNAVSYVGEKTPEDYVPFTGKCLPLFSILSTLNVMFEVDFFGLDIEDFELPVLKTIPFDSVFIKVFIIEIHAHLASTVVPFVESSGYICIHHINVPYTNDYVFIHKSLYEEGMKSMSTKECHYWFSNETVSLP